MLTNPSLALLHDCKTLRLYRQSIVKEVMLTSAMLQLYNDTLPGEYLELSHTALPTPPSSADSTGDQFLPATPPAAPLAPPSYSTFQYSVPPPRPGDHAPPPPRPSTETGPVVGDTGHIGHGHADTGPR